MLEYVYAGSIRIPSYGMLILIGIIVCNLIAQQSLRKDMKRYQDFLLIELVGSIGAVICAKLLTLLNGPMPITFLIEAFEKAGYSYYGGLFGFILFAYGVCKVRKIDGEKIAKEYIYLIPLLHVFWKIGCFLGGCCYGRQYDGPLAVCYPKGVNNLSGISVFPSPVVEAITAAMIMIILLFMKRMKTSWHIVGCYLFLYGLTRFILEFWRYHDNQSFFSVVHVYSIITVVVGIVLVIIKNRSTNYE